jgi:hypothetical protein
MCALFYYGLNGECYYDITSEIMEELGKYPNKIDLVS